MFTLNGKYGEATVFTDVVENEAISQVINLLNQPYAENAHIRLMPDIHAGAGCTIGTTMHIRDKVCPNLVGVDIGCGMLVALLNVDEIDFEKLDKVIREFIPSGAEIRETRHPYWKIVPLEYLYARSAVDIERAYKSIGTLGGGNHFIEVDRDEEGNLYLVIHSGSRHLGVEVAKFYQELAWRNLTSYSKEEIDKVISKLKAEGRQKEIQKTLESMKTKSCSVPKDLAYLEGNAMADYLHDMQIVQRFASWNRLAMADTILEKMGWSNVHTFSTIHNYIDTETMILRKGAVSAEDGEKLLIPINMRDGSLICIGKGDREWNCSAPHGAGRLYSRSKAKELFTVEEFESEMSGIYTTSVGQGTLDESPMAYKRIEDIVDNIGDTVDVIGVIKPIYNFKAGGD